MKDLFVLLDRPEQEPDRRIPEPEPIEAPKVIDVLDILDFECMAEVKIVQVF